MSQVQTVGGTGISQRSVAGAIGDRFHSIWTIGVPLPQEPTAKISCAVPTGHSGTGSGSGPSNRAAFGDDSITSYAVAFPVFWMWNVWPVAGEIVQAADRLGKKSSSCASTRSVRAAKARNDSAIESCEAVDRSTADAERSAAVVARSAMRRASAASASAAAAALRLSHHPLADPINAIADNRTATRSVLNQLTSRTVLVGTDTGGAS